jgi:hypothetical protein
MKTYGEKRKFSVGIATGYGLDGAGSIPGGSKIFPSAQLPGQNWDPLSLLSNEHRGLFPRGYSGRGVKLTTHIHLVPSSRKVELYLHSLLRLHGIVLN